MSLDFVTFYTAYWPNLCREKLVAFSLDAENAEAVKK